MPESIHIVINPLKDVVKSFMKRLTVKINNDKTSIVAISITDPTVKKAEVFLDNLIQIYNEDVAEDKSFISDNTSKFIANRLRLIAVELDGVENNVEDFKTSNELTDINSEAKLYIGI
jgi:uncharacterized protein involved in exopolysaccharide biosynthesis